MSMLNVLLTAQAPSPKSAALMNIVLLVVMFAVVYFFMIRPQKKKDKELQQMRSKLEIGDEVITTGGIIGRVVSIKDDTVVVETGTDRSKIRFLRNAIQYNTTAAENASEGK
ncbi:MAG: preprotein translocase subunit YajC [Oscillospiraceae bacterium]